MNWDEPLFVQTGPRIPAGRVRIGLDTDVKAAREAGATLSHAGVAALRSLADQIDQLERQLRSPAAKPYDRVPLGGLVREFRETYSVTFAALATADDPLTRALAQFLAADSAETGDPAGAGHPD
jgi:hypothetical protein